MSYIVMILHLLCSVVICNTFQQYWLGAHMSAPLSCMVALLASLGGARPYSELHGVCSSSLSACQHIGVRYTLTLKHQPPPRR